MAFIREPYCIQVNHSKTLFTDTKNANHTGKPNNQFSLRMEETAKYYRILDLKPGASRKQLKEAYRALVQVWHPDRFGHDLTLQAKAQEKLKEINIAFEILDSLGTSDHKTNLPCGFRVGNFRFFEGACEQFPSSAEPKENALTFDRREKERLSSFANRHRGITLAFINPDLSIKSLSRIVFESRTVTIYLRDNLSLKDVVFPITMLFVRDILRLAQKNFQRKRAVVGLHAAGWDGVTLFEGESYLKAEHALCGIATDEFIARVFKRNSFVAKARNFFLDIKAFRQHDIASSGRWLGCALKENPPASETWPQLLRN